MLEVTPPPGIKEITQDATNYEYSNQISLQIWLRTSHRLIKHGESYASQNYFIEAFKLYYRFIDLVVNKLALHPQLKLFKTARPNSVENRLYKEYMGLVNGLEPIMKECEHLKSVIISNHDEFMKEQKKLQELYKLRESHKSQQRRGSHMSNHSGQRKLTGSSSVSTLDSAHEEKLVKQLRSLSMNGDYEEVISDKEVFTSYPELPTVIEDNDDGKKNSFAGSSLPPQIPALPAKSSKSPTVQQQQQQHNHHQHDSGAKDILHKTVNFTEGGSPLRQVFISTKLKDEFLKIAAVNTSKGLETCGILCGKLSRNAFFITYLIIPEQESTENTCDTKNEENLFETIDNLDLFVLGWIHTHPTQSCFLSSVDLHTQNSYQIMLNEAIAIVCSPMERFISLGTDFGVFRLTDPPGIPTITRCNKSGFHPHDEENLYVNCNRTNSDIKLGHVIIRDGLPFTIKDLRYPN